MQPTQRVPVQTLFLALTLGACSGTPGEADAGADAPIVVPDVGAADGGNDAGDGICGDNLGTTSSWGPLPPSCLPRCTAATHAAIASCTTAACIQAALDADPTPSVRVRTRTGIQTVACGGSGCVPWQGYSCQSDFCPTQFDAWTGCVNAHGDCTAERAALTACTDASAGYPACLSERIDACFAP